MSSPERERRAPDQNDPTGHSRPGSPTYQPGNPPSNNLRPPGRPRKVSSEDEAGENAVGVLEQPDDTEPNVPPPMSQEGAPD